MIECTVLRYFVLFLHSSICHAYWKFLNVSLLDTFSKYQQHTVLWKNTETNFLDLPCDLFLSLDASMAIYGTVDHKWGIL